MFPADYIKSRNVDVHVLRHWVLSYAPLTPQQLLIHMRLEADGFNDALESLEIIRGVYAMAKKPFSPFTTKFAAIRLDAAEKKKFLAWKAENVSDGDVYYVELVRSGWKGSQSYDAENDCFIWSMTQRNERDINYDICVSSRSDNMYEAMLLGIYKLLILYPNQKLPTEAARDNWG